MMMLFQNIETGSLRRVQDREQFVHGMQKIMFNDINAERIVCLCNAEN